MLSKQIRRIKAFGFGIKHPRLLRKALKDSVGFLYEQGNLKRASLPQISIDTSGEIKLANFSIREGNVTHTELLIIVSLIKAKNPLNLLEIGTFDGNTTLQMALNSPENATIHTIDLPEGETNTQLPMWIEDLKYVTDARKLIRKCQNLPKIIQHFGDSSTYDFLKFGKLDFCFIDGGHSYACVKRDTEKTLAILNPSGTILWHDFTPNCPGVYKYLLEASDSLPLKHIAGTSLVLYEKTSK